MATARQLGFVMLWPNYFKSKLLSENPSTSLQFRVLPCLFVSERIFEVCFEFSDIIRAWPLQTQKKVVTATRSTLEVYSHNRRSHK